MVEDEVAHGEDLADFVENNSTSITFVMIQKFFILQIGGLHLWDCCVKGPICPIVYLIDGNLPLDGLTTLVLWNTYQKINLTAGKLCWLIFAIYLCFPVYLIQAWHKTPVR